MIRLGKPLELQIEDLKGCKDKIGLINKTENEYRRSVTALANIILESDKNIVFLTGPSSSGKTTTANLIAEHIKSEDHSVEVISLDNFYKNKEDVPRLPDGQPDLECFESLDVPLIFSTIKAISEKKDVEIPTFIFHEGRRGDETLLIKYEEDKTYIFEGIHALNPKLCENIPVDMVLKIYISCNSAFLDKDGEIVFYKREMRLIRRLVRDFHHRGICGDVTIGMWDDVMAGEKMWIRPNFDLADFYVNTVHYYEPMLYKKHLEIIVSEMTEQREAGEKLLAKFENIDAIDRSFVPKTSLLNEFLP